MRLLIFLLYTILLFLAGAQSQEITEKPICFTIINASDHRVYGEVGTDQITAPDGQKIHHTGSFRLEAAGESHPKKDYLIDRTEFCSSGPFYPNRQLEFTLRTLFPIFSCKISVELGEIIIQSKKYIKDGVTITKTWAICH